MKIARQKRFWIFAGLNGLLISLGFLYVFFQPTKRSFRKLATERALLKQLDEARYVEGSIAPSAATTNVRCNERDNDHVVRAVAYRTFVKSDGPDKPGPSKLIPFDLLTANGRVKVTGTANHLRMDDARYSTRLVAWTSEVCEAWYLQPGDTAVTILGDTKNGTLHAQTIYRGTAERWRAQQPWEVRKRLFLTSIWAFIFLFLLLLPASSVAIMWPLTSEQDPGEKQILRFSLWELIAWLKRRSIRRLGQVTIYSRVGLVGLVALSCGYGLVATGYLLKELLGLTNANANVAFCAVLAVLAVMAWRMQLRRHKQTQKLDNDNRPASFPDTAHVYARAIATLLTPLRSVASVSDWLWLSSKKTSELGEDKAKEWEWGASTKQETSVIVPLGDGARSKGRIELCFHERIEKPARHHDHDGEGPRAEARMKVRLPATHATFADDQANASQQQSLEKTFAWDPLCSEQPHAVCFEWVAWLEAQGFELLLRGNAFATDQANELVAMPQNYRSTAEHRGAQRAQHGDSSHELVLSSPFVVGEQHHIAAAWRWDKRRYQLTFATWLLLPLLATAILYLLPKTPLPAALAAQLQAWFMAPLALLPGTILAWDADVHEDLGSTATAAPHAVIHESELTLGEQTIDLSSPFRIECARYRATADAKVLLLELKLIRRGNLAEVALATPMRRNALLEALPVCNRFAPIVAKDDFKKVLLPWLREHAEAQDVELPVYLLE